jgi:hypothetical protein
LFPSIFFTFKSGRGDFLNLADEFSSFFGFRLFARSCFGLFKGSNSYVGSVLRVGWILGSESEADVAEVGFIGLARRGAGGAKATPC